MPRLVRIAIALIALPALAGAQPQPPPASAPAAAGDSLDEAKVHFSQGVALYNDGNFGAALAEFEASNKAHPSVGVLYNIGLCLKGQFRYAESIDTLTRYLTEAGALPKALPAERKVEVEQLVSEMRALLVDVQLAIAPDGARVAIDSRTIGVAPLEAQKLAVGHHVIEASRDGYKPGRKEVTLAAGMVGTLVKLQLEAIPVTGRVRIFSLQGNPLLKLDGKLLGPAPVELDLGAGGHTLEASSPGFRTTYTELVVAAGQLRSVPVQLERPKRRFYESWWFWTLTTAVLAGVAIGVSVYELSGIQDPLVGTLGASKVN